MTSFYKLNRSRYYNETNNRFVPNYFVKAAAMFLYIIIMSYVQGANHKACTHTIFFFGKSFIKFWNF